MATTLTYGGTTVALPTDLLWVDEYAWRPVEQRQTYTITGAQIVEAYAKQAGRAITLRGGANYAPVTRSVLESLRAWAAVPGRVFSLVLRSEAARTVAFDQAAGAIEATPLIDYSDVDANDQYVSLVLRFIEV